MVGDHLLITMTINGKKSRPIKSKRRSWMNYSKELLISELSQVTFDQNIENVQDCWNSRIRFGKNILVNGLSLRNMCTHSKTKKSNLI